MIAFGARLSQSQRALHRAAVVTAAATWILIIAGGLVTSTDSGLAVPDWPLSYGTWFPPMVGGIFFEHGHRMMAEIVGLMIVGLVIWLHRAEPRRWVRRLGDAALGAVIVQAVLGGLTVLFLLPLPVSVAHACLGQAVFCLIVILALATSPAWSHPSGPPPRLLPRAAAAMTTLVFAQLVLGAVVRHADALVVVHIAGGVVVAAGALALLVLALAVSRSQPGWIVWALALTIAVGAQIALGWMTWADRQAAVIASAHQAFAALILAASCAMAVMAFRLGLRPRSGQAAPAESGVGLSADPTPTAARSSRLSDYLALAKLRVTMMAVITTAVGFVIGSPHQLDGRRFWWTLAGAFLVGAGANTLNQWMERDADAKMRRTANRPLPAGRLRPTQALGFGLGAAGLGVAMLVCCANALAVVMALATFVSYVGCYTPLKRVSSLSTLVGAVSGALPPLIGWAAAAGSLSIGAWVLFGILFLWQLPHFLAIALVYQEDYARAGFKMLPVVEPSGDSTARQMLLYGLALLPTSLLPSIIGLAGPIYFVAALAVGCWLIAVAALAARFRTFALAKRLFLASIGYLPILLVLMVVDRVVL